jgi:hypothetical protein
MATCRTEFDGGGGRGNQGDRRDNQGERERYYVRARRSRYVERGRLGCIKKGAREATSIN